MRRIMNHMLQIAPWLSYSDRAALRAGCELEWLTQRVIQIAAEAGRKASALCRRSSIPNLNFEIFGLNARCSIRRCSAEQEPTLPYGASLCLRIECLGL